MSNLSAGIGDPYWYEWTVGLTKIVEMLHPESNIISVTFQVSEILGWDDVKVEYNNGHYEFYQIKHSRTDDTITFGDLVSVSDGKSLLSYLAKCWKEIPFNNESIFKLFTNRVSGKKKVKVRTNSNEITRPPLEEFIKEIKSKYKGKSKLCDIKIKDEYLDAYSKEWLKNLNKLSEEQLINFTNQLEIEAGQKSLIELEKEIIEKITLYLGISNSKALSILQVLDHALRKWCTSIRGSHEKITREDVYHVLSIPLNETVGNHELEPPTPFFRSREKEINDIINEIKNINNKVIFLTGAPGIGKTSLISKLINSREPHIHLRYYTFKPISPHNDLLPIDAGNTTTARVLWGDLLSEIRILFKGSLAKYNIPIRNDFISQVETLRNEVIRLSVELSLRTNQRTVICIDGIDHAARADIDINDNYLESLIPPDNIPDELLFIIAGQPPEYYEKYPSWLKSEKKGVKRIDVSNLTQADIKLLLAREIIGENEYASQIIYDHTQGNTLSVLYAVETIKHSSTIEDAKNILENSQLKDGLKVYYDKLWDSTSLFIDKHSFSLSKKIACVFSLTTAKLTAGHFSNLFPEFNEEEWSIILLKLSPLIIRENDVYCVLHNDAKVFFTKIIYSFERAIYEKIALKIFLLYLDDKKFIVQLHSEAIRLLKKAKQTHKILEIISPKFILEAYLYKCAHSELEEQLKLALNEAVKEKNISALHNISCCIKSFDQLNNEINGKQEWHFYDESKRYVNELRVVRKELWDLKTIEQVLNEALQLLRMEDKERSTGLLERWFRGLKISELFNLLPEVKKYYSDPRSDYDNLVREMESFFTTYGHILFYVNKSIIEFDLTDEQSKVYQAQITSGIIEELIGSNNYRLLPSVLQILPNYFFPHDYDKLLYDLFKKQEWRIAFVLLKNIDNKCITNEYKIIAAFVSLLSKNKSLIVKWYQPYENNLLQLFSNNRYDNGYYYLEYTLYSLLGFMFGWKDYSKDISEIVDIVSKVGIKDHYREDEVIEIKKIFRYSSQIGRWFSEIYDDNKKDNFTFMNESDLLKIVYNMLKQKTDIKRKDVVGLLLTAFIYCVESSDHKYQLVVNELLYNHYDDIDYDAFYEIIWSNLYKKGYYEKCEHLLINLIGPIGKLWKWSNSEKNDIINQILKITKNTHYFEIAQQASTRLKYYTISFSDHKDYNLYYEGIWLERLLEIDSSIWKTEGIKLLNLSNKVEKIADNRASNYVNKLLMYGAIKTSPLDAFMLYRLIQFSYGSFRTYLIDAIVDYYDKYELNLDNTKILWLLSCGYLYWCQYYDRKEVYRIKMSILNSQHAKANDELLLFMKNTNPIYYSIDYLDKIDENEYKPIKDVSNESIQLNLENIFDFDQADLDPLVAFIKRTKKERPQNFSEIITRVYHSLLNEQRKTYWGHNRYGDVYKEIFPCLSNEQKWNIGQNIINVFYEVDEYKNYYAFAENLNYYCLYFCGGDHELLFGGYNRLLQMHYDWLNGFENRDVEKNLEISLEQNYPKVTNWSEFSLQILLEKIDSSSGIETETGLSAIWQLIKYKPDIISYIANMWFTLSDDQKEYLLILFELVPIVIPNQIFNVKSILKKVYEGKNFSHKMQSYLVYNAISRIINEKIPEIPLNVNEVLDRKNSIEYPFQSVLKVGTDSSRFFSSIKNYHHLFERKIDFLEAVTGYELRDDFNEKLSYFISQNPIPVEKEKYQNSDLRGDFRISSREADEIFNTVAENEIRRGKFGGFSPLSIIQALLTNDDPVAFENKYLATKNISNWPEERSEIVNHDEVLKNLISDNIEEENILLCGEIRLYDSSKEYRGIINSYYVSQENLILKYHDSSTFNARSSFLYSNTAHNQNISGRSLFVIGGGISRLIYSNNWLIPSKLLFSISNWKVCPNNPSILKYENKKVAWMEKYFGPINTVDSRYDRQAAIQRWICTKDAFESLNKMLESGYEIKSKFHCEISNIDK